MTSEPAALTLIDDLLAEQQSLTAVERFSQKHAGATLPVQAKFYRDLIPLTKPQRGEQYAFIVDLDKCTGCKACVTACHSLNGLDEGESWRDVGVIFGGTAIEPVQQTVTAACHHCVDPACMNGCPTNAYDKDEKTGIVRHLDDQCIGCQYCSLKCPYDVPKYSKKRGIVRKCDMCQGRLAVGEAPACVQACPTAAIGIEIVNKEEIRRAFRGNTRTADTSRFLQTAPDPAYTLPTTRYKTNRVFPSNMAPADFQKIKPAHSHPPLVVMLVLTQLSVGAFCAATLLRMFFPANLIAQLAPFQSLVALALGLLAIGASVLHLGRPLIAWRAVVGLKTSWLSREIVIFGGFAGLAVVFAASFWLPPLAIFRNALGLAVCVSGLLGVFSSLMIYQDTRRKFWSGTTTALKFFGTTCLLGPATILFAATLQAVFTTSLQTQSAFTELTDFLSVALIATGTVKLAGELLVFRHLRDAVFSPLKRTALLMSGELGEATTIRFLSGALGGVVLPLVLLLQKPAPGVATLGITLWALVFSVAGELLERYLFFTAVIHPKMPGGME